MEQNNWLGVERVDAWSFGGQLANSRMVPADEFIGAALRWFGDADPAVGSPCDKGSRLAMLSTLHRTRIVLDGLEALQAGSGADEVRLSDLALQSFLRNVFLGEAGMCIIMTRQHVSGPFSSGRARSRRNTLLNAFRGPYLTVFS
jgi:hypothetical protein